MVDKIRVLSALMLVVVSALAERDFIGGGGQCFVNGQSTAGSIGPCLCPPGQQELLDLGRGHYPRYLISLVCAPAPCLKPPYVCSSLPYKTRVLKRREPNEDTRLDAAMPDGLRESWKFAHVTIIVACVCSV